MHITLITTATIPWFTGPAISSIERIYAIHQAGHKVTLYAPWVKPEIQRYIFPEGLEFMTKDEHLLYLHAYLSQHRRELEVKLYDANWEQNCLLPATSLDQLIEPCDILILEEAEHLLWNQILYRKIEKAQYIIGIIQTNYRERGKYSISFFNLKIQLFLLILPYYNALICRRNCDRVISVSRSIDYAAPVMIAPINGIRDVFLSSHNQIENNQFIKDFYYLGSVAWEKNFKQLIEFCQGCQVTIDIYGSGIHYSCDSTMDQIVNYSHKHGDYLNFCGTTSEPQKTLKPYKTYISCSTSEGYCAANAEAIAMGKFAILPRHPSNEFFYPYVNVLLFDNQQEFSYCIDYALNNEPIPLTPSELEQFSWQEKTKLLLSKFIALK
jgi:digalactosyldiacylglycerol synthase